MEKILKVLFIVIVLFVLVFAGGMLYLNKGLEKGRNVTINGLVMSNINDGVYQGIYKVGRWSNEVNVTVNDKKIVKIEIVKDVTFAKSEVRDELFSKVIEAQNTNVDIVSGATVTSRAYLKSIENALNNK